MIDIQEDPVWDEDSTFASSARNTETSFNAVHIAETPQPTPEPKKKAETVLSELYSAGPPHHRKR